VKRYLGKGGAKQLRSAIRALCLRRLGYSSAQEARRARAEEHAEFFKLARRLLAERDKATAARRAALALVGSRAHGRTVRQRRDVPNEASWATEYWLIPREVLEEATWPGITEEEWVGLRRGLLSELKRRSRLDCVTARPVCLAERSQARLAP